MFCFKSAQSGSGMFRLRDPYPSAFVLADNSVRSPQKIAYFFNLNIVNGAKYPQKRLFNFANKLILASVDKCV